MNYPLLATAFGFLKGFVNAQRNPSVSVAGPSLLHHLAGPAIEEVQYRYVPMSNASNASMPSGWTAVPFALEHLKQEARRGQNPTSLDAVLRFADVLIGGMTYEAAYRESGLLGAVVSHVAHNLATTTGGKVSREVRR